MMIICNGCKNFVKFEGKQEGEFVLKKGLGIVYESVYLCKSCLNHNKENYYRLEGAYPVMVNIEEKRG